MDQFEKEAFECGKQMYGDGLLAQHNPYLPKTERDAWGKGWLEAQRESKPTNPL